MNLVTVRERSGEGYTLTIDELIAKLLVEDKTKFIKK